MEFQGSLWRTQIISKRRGVSGANESQLFCFALFRFVLGYVFVVIFFSFPFFSFWTGSGVRSPFYWERLRLQIPWQKLNLSQESGSSNRNWHVTCSCKYIFWNNYWKYRKKGNKNCCCLKTVTRIAKCGGHVKGFLSWSHWCFCFEWTCHRPEVPGWAFEFFSEPKGCCCFGRHLLVSEICFRHLKVK